MPIAASSLSVALILALHGNQAPDFTCTPSPGDPTPRVIAAVPSYAGFWWAKTKAQGRERVEYHASLVNLGDSSRLRTVLDSLEINRAADGSRPTKPVIIEKAKYAFTQLDPWRCKIARKAVAANDWGAVGIRPNENRIRVVVRRRDMIEKIHAQVKSLGIPEDAFVVVVLGKPVYH